MSVSWEAGKKRKARCVASDEAHAWARRLPLDNPNAKTVLRALALYVNGEGCCFVGIDQVAEDTDLSPDTVRRRLVWLEQVGAIVRLPQWLDENGRRNGEGRGKRTTDEIRLLLDADVDEIERRAHGENDAISSPEEAEFSPSNQQGLNSASEALSPRSALGQPLQSCEGLTSEPEPEISPQPPSGGRLADDVRREGEGAPPEPEHFAFLKASYPDTSIWPWSIVLPVFAAMPAADQRWAAAASPDYAKLIIATKRKPPPVRPDKYLKQLIFRNFPNARLPEKKPELEPAVFYPEGGDVAAAMKAACQIGRVPFEPRWNGSQKGFWLRGEPGADFLAMVPFADVNVDDLPELVAEGSQEFAAWRDRLRKWTGFVPAARKIWTEAHDPDVHDLPFTHQNHRFRKHVNGLRVPWQFPPTKEGKPSPPKAPPPPKATNLMTDQDFNDLK